MTAKFKVIDVLTGVEADPYEIALKEPWAQHLMYCDMEGFAILEDGTLMLTDECGKVVLDTLVSDDSIIKRFAVKDIEIIKQEDE